MRRHRLIHYHIIESNKIFNPYSGVTTNISEGFNTLIKWVNNHKKLPVDNMILSLFYLQNAIYCEVLRGRANLGNYKLKSEFEYVAVPPEELKYPHNLIKADDILEHVKNNIKQRKIYVETLDISGGEATHATKSIINPSISLSFPTVANLKTTEVNEIIDDSSDINFPAISNGKTAKDNCAFNSQHELAKAVVKENGVRLVADMNAFMVQGVSNKKYTVTLFPKETCQCPSTGTCYHILAAKLSIGINIKPQQNERKLISLMRYKNRPKSQKRLGQKKTKPSDFELLIPAPDSKSVKLASSNSERIHMHVNEYDANSIAVSINKTVNETRSADSPSAYNKRLQLDIKPEENTETQTEPDIYLDLTDFSGLPDIMPLTTPVTVELKDGLPRNNEDELNAYWIYDLNLTMADKEILENNLWLNDKHMSATLKILREQFNINGLQDTTKIPFYQETSQSWNTENRFLPQSAPSVQIHFDGNNHWATSIQSAKEPDTVYYVDSLGDNIKHLKFSVQIQLSQIYHNNRDVLNVKIPRCQQQPNGNDCGLFAIANAVEFCFNTGNVNFNYAFKVDDLRSHLADCLENGKFTKFPKQFSRDRASTFSGISKQISFDLWCSCRMPEFIDNMISCNNKKCKTWFHQRCIGLNNRKKSIKNWKWKCLNCNKVNGIL